MPGGCRSALTLVTSCLCTALIESEREYSRKLSNLLAVLVKLKQVCASINAMNGSRDARFQAARSQWTHEQDELLASLQELEGRHSQWCGELSSDAGSTAGTVSPELLLKFYTLVNIIRRFYAGYIYHIKPAQATTSRIIPSNPACV